MPRTSNENLTVGKRYNVVFEGYRGIEHYCGVYDGFDEGFSGDALRFIRGNDGKGAILCAIDIISCEEVAK